MRMSDSINELAAALAKAQGEIKGALKDSANPHFKSRYADLASVWDACRGPLSKHGLAVIQGPASEEGGKVSVTTLIAHSSGQWIESTVSAVPMKNDAQGVGSVITYNRRYGLAAMVGVAPEDDDGEAAAGRPQHGNNPVVKDNGASRAPLTPPAPVAPPATAATGDKNGDPAVTWYRQRLAELEAAHGPKPMVPDQLTAWKKKHWSAIERLREQGHDDMAQHLTDLYNELWQKPAYAA